MVDYFLPASRPPLIPKFTIEPKPFLKYFSQAREQDGLQGQDMKPTRLPDEISKIEQPLMHFLYVFPSAGGGFQALAATGMRFADLSMNQSPLTAELSILY